MSEIVVVVPVLGRPQRVAPLVASFLAARTVESRLLFVYSPDRPADLGAVAVSGCDRLCALWEPGGGDFARKVNYAFRASAEPFLFQAADDVDFQRGWDTEALRVAEETGAGVVGTNDQANPAVVAGRHSTHSLIRRSYVDECGGSADGPGVVFHEGYGHQWVDNELVELARSRGCFASAHRSVVRHSHPIWGTAEDDDTYRKGAATAAHDQALFMARRRLWR